MLIQKRREKLKKYFFSFSEFRELCFCSQEQNYSLFKSNLTKLRNKFPDLEVTELEFDWFTYLFAGNKNHGFGLSDPECSAFTVLGQELSLNGKLHYLWHKFNLELFNFNLNNFKIVWENCQASDKVAKICDGVHLNCIHCFIVFGYTDGLMKMPFTSPPGDNQTYHLMYLLGKDQRNKWLVSK